MQLVGAKDGVAGNDVLAEAGGEGEMACLLATSCSTMPLVVRRNVLPESLCLSRYSYPNSR